SSSDDNDSRSDSSKSGDQLSMQQVDDSLDNSNFKLYAYNQADKDENSVTARDHAESVNLPVVEFDDEMSDDTDYISWMNGNLDELKNLGEANQSSSSSSNSSSSNSQSSSNSKDVVSSN
ncbi:MAG: hypothetical protein QM632_01165, partial [Micrococcaceae bacterium]